MIAASGLMGVLQGNALFVFVKVHLSYDMLRAVNVWTEPAIVRCNKKKYTFLGYYGYRKFV